MKQPSKYRIVCVIFLLLAVLLQGCSSNSSKNSGKSNRGAYGYGDGPPPKDIDVSVVPDAVPKVEPILRAGNKNPYTVFGKTYHLLPTSNGYRERGIASWYGNKFHGRKTSNGEIYDMYAMTAAHKTLPIPCYVKVTNLENGRSVIVRVNDRGPFHGDRIIDLSYAAAKKLDYSIQGTANVEVVAINPRDYQAHSKKITTVEHPRQAVGPNTEITNKDLANRGLVNSDVSKKESFRQEPLKKEPTVTQKVVKNGTADDYRLPSNTYLQIGAFRSESAATGLLERVQDLSSYPVVIRRLTQPSPLFKVLIGPVKDNLKLLDLRNLLSQTENLSSFVVYE